jgi:hypothetical protein
MGIAESIGSTRQPGRAFDRVRDRVAGRRTGNEEKPAEIGTIETGISDGSGYRGLLKRVAAAS